MIQQKRTKNGGDISSDLEALRMEDLDSTFQPTPTLQPDSSYASKLKNPVDRYRQTMMEDFEFTDDDCVYTQGKHGQNVSFSEKVHNKLDYDWRCAVVVKLMGKPNSTNTFDFMLKGLRRKWQTKGGWQLIDLANDFFIVKFNLEEDMNNVLCGGPWILAGQTLIVRKWKPDFDPMNEIIGKMALWVRICGLPVKYFKDYTVAKIGKILGDVVKVDQVTIGQARGKFARVCVEVDLSKPLRPFVEVESVAYNVVYEGISLICFECGCFGHAKDKCPSVHIEPNLPTQPQDSYNNIEDQVMASTEKADLQHELDTSKVQIAVIKEDMGPWMLMNYRNKKKTNDTGGVKRNANKGSRFAVLQDEDTITEGEPKTIDDNSAKTSTPSIVKLWTSFQDKKKNLNKATSTKTGTSSVFNDSGVGSSASRAMKAAPRVPMHDVSNNIVSSSNSKSAMKYQRKTKGTISSTTKHQPNVSKKLSFENIDANVLGNGISAIFGHCPPEETLMDDGKHPSIHQASDCFVEKTFADNSMLTINDNQPSQVEEGMVDA